MSSDWRRLIDYESCPAVDAGKVLHTAVKAVLSQHICLLTEDPGIIKIVEKAAKVPY